MRKHSYFYIMSLTYCKRFALTLLAKYLQSLYMHGLKIILQMLYILLFSVIWWSFHFHLLGARHLETEEVKNAGHAHTKQIPEVSKGRLLGGRVARQSICLLIYWNVGFIWSYRWQFIVFVNLETTFSKFSHKW